LQRLNVAAYLLPEDTIERFAEIAALVDDGYVPRLDLLAAAGLDHTSWKHLERHWMVCLAEGTDADLAVRFATTYARTRASLASTTASEAHEPYRPGDADDTLREGGAAAAHRAGQARVARTGTIEPGGDSQMQMGAAGPLARVDVTVVCAADAAARGVLPFMPPAAMPSSESPPPGKRLALFDTQTGERLATPVWIDAPEDPKYS
jgi:hypothetical protein